MKINKPILGQVTQGTLFNCVTADRYRDKQVHGLAITARCDVANDKYPVLNYLPVVKLIDWMHCDGVEILLGNALKSSKGNFESSLKQAKVAVSVLISVPRQEVVASFFDDNDASKKKKELARKARDQADHLDHLEALNLERVEDRNFLLTKYANDTSTLTRNLIQGKLSGFYYLPSVTEENENSGYVVLLRESNFLPREIAKKIASGIDQNCSSVSQLNTHLSFQYDDFAMSVGQMPSPNIEHVLQTFSYMFGRIGLEDYDDDFVSEVCAQNFVKEGTA